MQGAGGGFVAAKVSRANLHPCCAQRLGRSHTLGRTNASGSEALLQEKGVRVEILEDADGVAQYARFRQENPEQDLEDWQGLSAVMN